MSRLPGTSIPLTKLQALLGGNLKCFANVLHIDGPHAAQFTEQPFAGRGATRGATSITFEYTVPRGLCLGNGELALSSVVALFDEFSTRAIVLKDRSSRPGVSMFLSGRKEGVVDDEACVVRAGEKVRITSRADKIGGMVAFCSLELSNENGQVAFTGKHIKFLHMGRLFQFVMGVFPLRSLMLDALDKDSDTIVNKLFGDKIRSHIFPKVQQSSHSVEEIERESSALMRDDIGAAFDNLPITRISPIDDGSDSSQSNQSTTWQLQSLPVLNNPMGKVHGGAIALAAQRCSALHLAHQTSVEESEQLQMTSMQLTYMNASQGLLRFQCDGDVRGGLQGRSLLLEITGSVYDQVDNTCVSYTSEWTKPRL